MWANWVIFGDARGLLWNPTAPQPLGAHDSCTRAPTIRQFYYPFVQDAVSEPELADTRNARPAPAHRAMI
ncbi:hypothetical protein PC119_g23376 [Phytophthora cactorum]|nr:hypothetical protein PC112_g21062 [Phytophthora cactorum]KAG2874471.1 hypothetical protein PC114_g25257 [Phytophthora cactorum]KAG2971508.1 hypothetical protein PC119_g23376 [Phytophthora cactorum]